MEPEEAEYDLYNDETFGALEDSSALDDWEQQHEQLAEIEESNKRTENKGNIDSIFVIKNTNNLEFLLFILGAGSSIQNTTQSQV